MTESFWCRIAVSRPSRPAPSVIRCSCSSRCPLEVKLCGRVSASRTGRPTCRAAIAASVTCGQTIALEPKPPPTKWVITRTSDSGMPSNVATVSWLARTPIVESQSVSRSPSHCAVVTEVSSGLWWFAAKW